MALTIVYGCQAVLTPFETSSPVTSPVVPTGAAGTRVTGKADTC